MGYNADKHAKLLSPPSGKRKRKLNFNLKVKSKNTKSTENLSVLPQKQLIQNQPNSMLQRVYQETSEQCSSDLTCEAITIIDSGDPPLQNFEGLDDQK